MSSAPDRPATGSALAQDLEGLIDPYDYYSAMVAGSRAEQVFHNARLELVQGITALSGKRILDVGGGTGCLALPLAQSGYDVTVVEPGIELLGTLQRHATSLGVEVEGVHADGRHLPMDDASFDVVLLASVVHLVPWPEPLLHEAERVCRPDGRIVVAGPWQRHPKSMPGVKTVLRDGPLSALRGRSSKDCKATFPFNRKVLAKMLRRSRYLGSKTNYVLGYLAMLWAPDRSA